MPKTSAMLVELPMVTMLPPDSTNFLSLGLFVSSEIRPSMLWYSAGTVAGSGAPKPPPPPPPPRPPAAPRRMAPSAKTMTSNLRGRQPARPPPAAPAGGAAADGAIGEDDDVELTIQIARVEGRGIDPFEGEFVLLEKPTRPEIGRAS